MDDPWAAVKAWRTRRAGLVKSEKPTYDAYPDNDVPPEMRFYIEARDIKGRLLREYVDLEGYSVHQLNWRQGATRGGMQVRDWFISQMLISMVRLSARLDEVKERRREFDYPAKEKL